MIITLPIPVSNNVYYRRSRWSTYISTNGLKYKETVAGILQFYTPSEEELAIGITIHPALTKKGLPSRKVLDIDNYDKCLLDSLKGFIFVDDKQVKRYDFKQYGVPVKGGAISIYIRQLNNWDMYLTGRIGSSVTKF